MADELFPKRDKDPTEGVRIIGAEEAEKAIEREDVAQRLPEDAPRFGDRPEQPPDDGPRPAIRFPLSGASDPRDIERPPIVPPDPPAMPHWTEPATGEVPRVFASDQPEEDLDAWSSFTSGQPRWQGEGTAHDDDHYDDFSRLADDETRVGALDPDTGPADDFFEFDDEPEPEPVVPATRAITSDPRRTPPRSSSRSARAAGGGGAGRDVPTAVGVGAGLAVLLFILAKAGPKPLMVLVVGVLGLAIVELFSALRRGGYHPATLVGIVATVAMPIAAYTKGDVAIPLVLFLTVVVGLIWYLIGAGGEDAPILGLSSTLLGVCYVGVLGSFAALSLTLDDGIGVLYGALLTAVAYDVGGFFVGRSFGTRRLSEVSPNKTVEGLLGGALAAVVAIVVIGSRFSPWAEAGITGRAVFGIAAAVAACCGDLGESLLKRDLGVKDMGSILPEHGGILDRFDALLFVLPTTYYAAHILF